MRGDFGLDLRVAGHPGGITPDEDTTMATTELTDTVERIAAVFKRLHDEADAANREATTGPFRPYGEPYEDPCWHGTIREAWEQDQGSLRARFNDDREANGVMLLAWDQWEGNRDEIEDHAVELARQIVGRGDPLYIAFHDGLYPIVFCEDVTDAQIEAAAASFYPD